MEHELLERRKRAFARDAEADHKCAVAAAS